LYQEAVSQGLYQEAVIQIQQTSYFILGVKFSFFLAIFND
jgi:hypothetical protein